jgi:hypothetical protein
LRKDVLILLLILIPAAAVMIYLARNISPNEMNNSLATNSPYPTISLTSSNVEINGSITPSASANIEVLAPLTGDSIKTGFVVKGNARTFENVVNVRLSDSNGNVLNETYTTANAPDVGQFGPFNVIINYTTDATEGILEVFQYSAKDGSEIDKVIIPLQFGN